MELKNNPLEAAAGGTAVAHNGATLPGSSPGAIADIELQLLLEAIVRVNGYDFRNYAATALRRRVSERVRAEGLETISGLQEKVLHDPFALERLVQTLSTNSTSLF